MPNSMTFLKTIQSAFSRRSVRLTLYWALGLFTAYALLGFFAVPPLAKWAIERKGSEALGRAVSVDRVSFNPLTLTATVEDFHIADVKGNTPFAAFKRLDADLDISSAWHGGPVLKSLRLTKPAFHVVRERDFGYNFRDILARLGARPKAKSDEPVKFSVNNIELVEGDITFDDVPVSRQHRVAHLNVGVPFVSNFPAAVDIYQTPRLEALINGAPLVLTGKLKPFADHKEAFLDVALRPFDVTQYLSYFADALPVRIAKGHLDTNLRVAWSHAGEAGQNLAISGAARLTNVLATDRDGGSLTSFDALVVDITKLQPLSVPLSARILRVGIEGLVVDAHRAQDGVVNLTRLASSDPMTGQAPNASDQANAAGAKIVPAARKLPEIMIDSIQLKKGHLRWLDDAVTGSFKLTLTPIEATVSKFNLTGSTPAHIAVKASSDTGEGIEHVGDFVLSQGHFEGLLTVKGASLQRLRPYFDQFVGPAEVSGLVNGQARYVLEAKADAPSVKVTDGQLKVTALSMTSRGQKQPLVSLTELGIDGVSLDSSKRELSIGAAFSEGGQWRMVREENGSLNLLTALLPSHQPAAVGTAKPALAAPSLKTAHEPATNAPWHVSVGRASLSGWDIRFDDKSGDHPVGVSVNDFHASMQNWSNAASAVSHGEVGGRVNKKGQFLASGDFNTSPLKGNVKLDLKSVDLVSVQPYVDAFYRILVTQGAVSAQGQLSFDLTGSSGEKRAENTGAPIGNGQIARSPKIRYTGSLAVEDFNSLDQINDTDFVRWKRLAFGGIQFDLSPLSLITSEIKLDDFYTRLILDAQGRFNLRELASVEDEPLKAAPTTAQSSAPSSTARKADVAPAREATPTIRIGKLTFTDGHVNYSDRFVKPNYDANLRGVTGTLAGLSTDQTSLADLNLRAKLDGYAPVEVAGQLNPFRRDRFLDIRANAKDVDLTGVSTYAAKYVGYGIQKGKLSMDLQYKIRERKLTAENHVNLDQLTFGERVESPQATKLPVLFAVALLKNRHGEIDVNLPISGTLDDPEFSVGGVLVRVVLNLISRAVTAPFSLLGSLFGGGEELSSVDFAPGSAMVTASAEEKLRSLAKALSDRPALRLEIAGVADSATDRAGLKHAVLEARMRAAKAATLLKRGQEVDEVDRLAIASEEYPVLLESVYAAEKLPDKPRNAIGLLKKVPPEEMEKRLLDFLTVDDAALESLGAQRAQAVRDWFVDHGGVDPDRVFLVNASALARREKGKPASPRADFSLR